jgi:hypothetical protein
VVEVLPSPRESAFRRRRRLFHRNVDRVFGQVCAGGASTVVGHDRARFGAGVVVTGAVYSSMRALILALSLAASRLAHRFLGFEMDSARAMSELMHNRIRQSGIADVVVQVGDIWLVTTRRKHQHPLDHRAT